MINEVIDISKDNIFNYDNEELVTIQKTLKLDNYYKRLLTKENDNINIDAKLMSMIHYTEKKLLKYYCNKLCTLYNCESITIYSSELPSYYCFFDEEVFENKSILFELLIEILTLRMNHIVTMIYLKEKGIVLVNNRNNKVGRFKNTYKTDNDKDFLLELEFYEIKHKELYKLCEKSDKFHIYY